MVCNMGLHDEVKFFVERIIQNRGYDEELVPSYMNTYARRKKYELDKLMHIPYTCSMVFFLLVGV